jgi:hypothetical protein
VRCPLCTVPLGSKLDGSVVAANSNTPRAGNVAVNLNQQSKHDTTGSLNKCKSLGSLFAQAVRASLLGPPVILRAAHRPLFAFAPAAPGFPLVLCPFARLEQNWTKEAAACSRTYLEFFEPSGLHSKRREAKRSAA